MGGGGDGGGEVLGRGGVKGLDDILGAGYVEGVLLVVTEHLTHHGVAADIVNEGLVHGDSNLEEAPIVGQICTYTALKLKNVKVSIT